jgi:putative sugar O-methyltransferase
MQNRELHAATRVQSAKRQEQEAVGLDLQQQLRVAAEDIRSREVQVSQLTRQLAELEDHNARFERENAHFEQDNARFEQENAGLQEENAYLQEENARLQHENTMLERLRRLPIEVSGSFAANTIGVANLLSEQEATLRNLGFNEISGLLNWPEISNEHERHNGFAELVNQMRLAFQAPEADASRSISSAWEVLNRKNVDQLLRDGYRNFKRTVATNYFTFPIEAGDPQISALQAKLTPEEIAHCWRLAKKVSEGAGDDGLADPLHYRYMVLSLWTFARKLDQLKCLDRLSEPSEGNPILVKAEGQGASQDLANSVIEYYSMREGVAFDSCRRILEIGGGYGRDAHVILSLHPQLQYTMVDIPPALFVAQRYLSEVFPELKVFRVRDFESFEDVAEEMEEASIVFLLPHQLKKLPADRFDLVINISSFGEMTRDQIDEYFDQIDRITHGHLYTKQWQISKNPFDKLVIKVSDYPVKPVWTRIFLRPCAVQPEFFEALYRVGGEG